VKWGIKLATHLPSSRRYLLRGIVMHLLLEPIQILWYFPFIMLGDIYEHVLFLQGDICSDFKGMERRNEDRAV
jgi:hypothetical protein